MLEDLFLLSSSHTIVFPSRFSSLLPIGPSYLPTLDTMEWMSILTVSSEAVRAETS